MTALHFIAVLLIVVGSWLAMAFVMRTGPANWWRMLIVIACFATLLGGFVLGDHWSGRPPDYYLCKPGQHCFPWGD